MVVNLEILAAWVGIISAIVAPLCLILKRANTLLKRLSDLEGWTRKQQFEIENSRDERRILLTGTLACLEGLHEKGCNGAVTKSIDEIKMFLFEESHRGKSEEGFPK